MFHEFKFFQRFCDICITSNDVIGDRRFAVVLSTLMDSLATIAIRSLYIFNISPQYKKGSGSVVDNESWLLPQE